MKLDDQIERVRGASRDIVRQLGFMGRRLANTDLSASAIHALIEIGQANGLTGKDLAARLLLEKSSVSRLAGNLEARGYISVEQEISDGRAKLFQLTEEGRKILAGVDAHSNERVAGALNRLGAEYRSRAVQGLRDYADALKGISRNEERFDIVPGYVPGTIGAIVGNLSAYVTARYPFGDVFERRLAVDMAEFVGRIDHPLNQTWRAEIDSRIVGGISIDGQDLENGLAHLRWFTLGEDARGKGIGKALLRRALEFCEGNNFTEIHLWTLKGLNAARHLYLKEGFRLTEEYSGSQWGGEVVEHKYVKILR